MQELLNGCQDPGDDQDRQDGALVACLGNVEAENVPVGHLARVDSLGHTVAVDQVRHDHGHRHAGTEELVAAETLCGCKADQNRQEGKRRRGQQINKTGNVL